VGADAVLQAVEDRPQQQGGLQVTEAAFDGLIASDKFCWTRHGQLRLDWWRRPLRLRLDRRV
jgi:hypothetical protein